MAQYTFYLASSLEKVFPCKRVTPLKEELSGLQNEVVSFQLVYYCEEGENGMPMQEFEVSVEGGPVRMRRVDLLPSDYPCYSHYDTNYITTEPGMFPDLLSDFDGKILPISGQMRSIWMELSCKDFTPGTHTLNVRVKADEVIQCASGEVIQNDTVKELNWEQKITLKVLKTKLPEQTLLHTEWFHVDCLADYYKVPVFGEQHWVIVENYIRFAAKECGVNLLLTPIFTPPLDTAVGGERTTVQLVEIVKVGKEYRFDFKQLDHWCNLCQKYGITHLEIAHFFTQWGAKATPKIAAMVEGEKKRIFGWDVAATDPSYRLFLEAFVPKLQSFLKDKGYSREQIYFHISDEPNESHIESYQAAKKQVENLLEGYQIIDALSSYEFYEKGIVKNPIPANDHIQPFIDHGVKDLWVYYCCVQGVNVPNRFYSMPSARNRIMGVLMYLYDIKGFLQWGFNFYNSKYSIAAIDPYKDTHSSYAFPSGDPYLVYPGADGNPVSSIRNQVQMEAFYDLRALRLLEELVGRETVENLIMEGVTEKITFSKYPKSADYLLKLRRKVNREIEKTEGRNRTNPL